MIVPSRRAALARLAQYGAAFCVAVALAAACWAGRALAQPIAGLSDEFEDPATLPLWLRVHQIEQWNAEQLESWDIDATQPGRMVMIPYTCTWYRDYRGPFAFKAIDGDFVLTTRVHASGRDGVSVPQALFSLAGIMVRTPRAITPATWTPGGENYVFLSLGYGNAFPRTFQFEVKTTLAGDSQLILSPSPSGSAGLQVARLGSAMIMLRQEPGQPWTVHRRYERPDFPDTLQAGLVSYTDWAKVQDFDPYVHNSNVLRLPLPGGVVDPTPAEPFAPDLIAAFDYVRFLRPAVPPELAGADFGPGGPISDAQLLTFLGAAADVPAGSTAVGDRPPGQRNAQLALSVAPNPFNPATVAVLRLEASDVVAVRVLDARGRLLCTLFQGVLSAGEHRMPWDGRDAAGRRVGSGVFTVVAQGREDSDRVSVVLAK